MTASTTITGGGRPRLSTLDRATAARLMATEYRRLLTALQGLDPEDWSRPTVCPGWDVHAMACHVLGMAELASSTIEQTRQVRAARRAGGLFIDALTGLQVSKHVHEPPARIVAKLDRVTPRAARHRARTPSLVRRIKMADQPVDARGEQTEVWTVGYLVDVILTRDTWMHRSDLAEATGRPMQLSPEHDGALVADVAAEWAGRHGRPIRLTLTGPAGGAWQFGSGGPSLELDAVEFCRLLSGRGDADQAVDLLGTRVPF